MKGYFLAVFAVCVITGLFGFLSQGRLRSAERIAMGIITLYVIIAPLSDLVRNTDPEDLFATKIPTVGEVEGGYEEVAEAAFERGIRLAVAEEYSLKADNIRVQTEGFSFEDMRAERIRVILRGDAALSDYREIESFLEKQEFGECEVEIEIG